MSVTDSKNWIKLCRGHEEREMPADAICTNLTAFVTEDAEHWIVNYYDGRKPCLHPKKTEPYYPVALVAKWGYKAVDFERIEQMAKKDIEETKKQFGWD